MMADAICFSNCYSHWKCGSFTKYIFKSHIVANIFKILVFIYLHLLMLSFVWHLELRLTCFVILSWQPDGLDDLAFAIMHVISKLSYRVLEEDVIRARNQVYGMPPAPNFFFPVNFQILGYLLQSLLWVLCHCHIKTWHLNS